MSYVPRGMMRLNFHCLLKCFVFKVLKYQQAITSLPTFKLFWSGQVLCVIFFPSSYVNRVSCERSAAESLIERERAVHFSRP